MTEQTKATFPQRIMEQLLEIARRTPGLHSDVWYDDQGPMQDDADAAIAWINAAADHVNGGIEMVAAPAMGETAYRCVGCKHVYFESNVSCDCEVPALRKFTACHIVDAAPVVPAPGVRPAPFHPSASHIHPEYRDGWNAALAATPRQAAPGVQLSEPPEGCEWSTEQFKAWKEDETNLHSAWFVVMPGGAMLQFNHHAIDAVDKARANWVSAVCNAALGRS